MMTTITTSKAPAAIGPYSQAVKIGPFLFLSGQIPINPKTNQVEDTEIALQTKQVMANIQAILAEEGLGFEHVVKTTIFIKDMEQFSIINDVYGLFLGNHRPARSTVEVSRLPKDVQIEIEAIATINK